MVFKVETTRRSTSSLPTERFFGAKTLAVDLGAMDQYNCEAMQSRVKEIKILEPSQSVLLQDWDRERVQSAQEGKTLFKTLRCSWNGPAEKPARRRPGTKKDSPTK